MEMNDFVEICKRVNNIVNEEDGKFISNILLDLRESNQIDDTHLLIIYFIMKEGWYDIKTYFMKQPKLYKLDEVNTIIKRNIDYHFYRIYTYFKDECITFENISKTYEEINKLY